MDKVRVHQEMNKLADKCRTVDYDLNKRYVKLVGVQFPDGWTPDIGHILFTLPRDYPQTQPDAHLPRKMRYRGEKPMIMHMNEGPPRWARHCIARFGHRWVPEYHTLLSLTRMIGDSLQKPNRRDPWYYRDA